MVKKKIGRPPAQWVHQLAALDRPDDEYLDYHDLCELFGLSMRSVHAFCTKAEINGEYYKTEEKAVRKRFKVRELKEAAAGYIAKW